MPSIVNENARDPTIIRAQAKWSASTDANKRTRPSAR
jgi:hypothetical protein